jgi:hypothetical protein
MIFYNSYELGLEKINWTLFILALIFGGLTITFLKKALKYQAKNKEIKKSIFQAEQKEIKKRFIIFWKHMAWLLSFGFTIIFCMFTVFSDRGILPVSEKEEIKNTTGETCEINNLKLLNNAFNGNYYCPRTAVVCDKKVVISDNLYKNIRVEHFKGIKSFEVWFNDQKELIAIRPSAD